MKKFFLIPSLSFPIILFGQPPAGTAEKGMTFGVITSEKDAVNANELFVLNSKESKAVKVKERLWRFARRKVAGCEWKKQGGQLWSG